MRPEAVSSGSDDVARFAKPSHYAAMAVTKAPHWHGLVAWDMLFNNLTAGLFLVAGSADLLALEAFTPVLKAAYPLALALLLADLACLVFDLGDPWRFHHMLRVFKPRSPMSLGTWCLTLYSFPVTVAAALSFLSWDGFENRPLDWIRRALVIIGVIPALGVAAYKGVLLSTTAQPGWRDARWLGGYLANSAIVLGCAALLLIAEFLGQERAGGLLRTPLIVLLLLRLFPFGLVVFDLRPALSRAYTPAQRAGLALVCVGVGTLIPLVLLLAEGSLVTVLAVLGILAGSLATRFVIVRLPHLFS